MKDFQYAARALRQTPSFTAGAVLTIAFAVGSNVAVFSGLYGVLLRPLPVADGDRLVMTYLVDRELRQETNYVSHVIFREWETNATTLSHLAAIASYRLDLTGDGPAHRVDVEVVSPGFFETVAVAPILGRTFGKPAKEAEQFPSVIGHGLWQSRYGGDPGVLGRTIRSSDLSFVIVGVMPRSFDRWRGKAQVWVPIDGVPRFASVKTERGYYSYHVIGRLRRGATLTDAASELERIAAPIEPERRGRSGPRHGVNVRSLREDVVGATPQRMLLSLGLMVALVWVIATANVGSLLLARNVDRATELAIRSAVGATRQRLVRQLLSESLLLATAGGLVGLVIAGWMIRLLHTYGPASLAREGLITLDATSAGLAVVAVALTTLAIGVWPAIGPLREIGSAPLRSRSDTKNRRSQDWFVGVQAGIAIVVMIGAISVVRAFVALQRVDMGFDPDSVVTLRASLPARYFASKDGTARAAVHERITQQVRAIPGVREMALGDLPVPYPSSPWSVTIERGGRYLNGNPKDRPWTPGVHFISPDYFRTLGIELAAGRDFVGDDMSVHRAVVIINRTMARMHWPDQHPIGRRITFGNVRKDGTATEPWLTIVGVVDDVRYGTPDAQVRGEAYLPVTQTGASDFSVLARSTGNATAVSQSVQQAIQAIDADISVFDIRSLADRLADTTAEVRYRAGMLVFFGTLALLLTTMGLNAVTGGRVARRQRELAVRAALGAAAGQLVRLVLQRTLSVLLVATTLGIGTALSASRWLASEFSGIIRTELSTVLFAALALIAMGTMAALVPAWRATRVDPMSILRAE